MPHEYYSYSYKLNGNVGHLIWFSNDEDGVYVDAGEVPSFDTLDDLTEFARSIGVLVESDDSVRLDLDFVAKWLNEKDAITVDCASLLDAWNLFDDVSRSVDGRFDADRKLTKGVYDKLFWGNNLPAMTPDGEHYDPIWSKAELDIIREVLSTGLTMFITCVSRR